jgi:hypothetical protein
VARERAAQRREQVEQHRAAHQAFDGLAADLAVEFRARAVAIDAVIGEFAQVMTAYRATVQRLGEFAPSLRQGPSPAPGHEMDLLTRVDKLSVSVLIARQLAVAGVLDPRTVPSGQRDPGFTFESYVMRQLEAFLTVARSWLPPVPDTTTNESPLTEQEGAHHGEQQIRG